MTLSMITLAKLVLVIAVGFIVNATARRGIDSLADRDLLSAQPADILAGLTKWAIIILVIVTCLQIVGISVTAIWAGISAVLMLVAVGFVAVWSILSNASCALFLVIFAPFSVGDEIEILEPSTLDPAKPGLRGKVRDISFLYTTLEGLGDGEESLVRIPNNQFFQKAIRCHRGSDTTSLKQALFGHRGENSDDS
jgi:small-conductance mechanosensitive channel